MSGHSLSCRTSRSPHSLKLTFGGRGMGSDCVVAVQLLEIERPTRAAAQRPPGRPLRLGLLPCIVIA